MIGNIIKILAVDDWNIKDEDIDIAKGKYAPPKGFRRLRKKIKRWL